MRLTRMNPAQLNDVRVPWHFNLRLNASEALLVSGLPVGREALPGQPPAHPRQLRPLDIVQAYDRPLVEATAPGSVRLLGQAPAEAMHGSHLIGVTGAGKSTLLTRAVLNDLEAGRGVIVIDPKGDLIEDILARVPKHLALSL